MMKMTVNGDELTGFKLICAAIAFAIAFTVVAMIGLPVFVIVGAVVVCAVVLILSVCSVIDAIDWLWRKVK